MKVSPRRERPAAAQHFVVASWPAVGASEAWDRRASRSLDQEVVDTWTRFGRPSWSIGCSQNSIAADSGNGVAVGAASAAQCEKPAGSS